MTDPQTDLEINCRAQLSILEACRAAQPVDPDRVREHAPDLRPARLPAGGREASAPPGRRERHQQGGRRVVPPPLQPTCTACRATRAAPDEHLRPAHASEGRAPDLPRHLDRARPSRGEPFEVWGGDQLRDFTYVDDAVDAFLLAAGGRRRSASVFNLGGAEVVSLEDARRLAGRGRGQRLVCRSATSRPSASGSTSATTTRDDALIASSPRLGAAGRRSRKASAARSPTTGRTWTPTCERGDPAGLAGRWYRGSTVGIFAALGAGAGLGQLHPRGRGRRRSRRSSRPSSASRAPSAWRTAPTPSSWRCGPSASGAGDGVITVSHTAVATVAAIERIGAVAGARGHRRSHVHDGSRARVERVIDRPPEGVPLRALLPVHLYGAMADMASLCRIASASA